MNLFEIFLLSHMSFYVLPDDYIEVVTCSFFLSFLFLSMICYYPAEVICLLNLIEEFTRRYEQLRIRPEIRLEGASGSSKYIF